MATSRQKKFAQNLLDHRGSAYQAAIDAGYSPGTASNPDDNIISRSGFQNYIKKELGLGYLVKWHKKAIEYSDDGNTVLKGVELGYRLHKVIEQGGQQNQSVAFIAGAGNASGSPTDQFTQIPEGYNLEVFSQTSDSGAQEVRENDPGAGQDSDIGEQAKQ